MARVRKPAAPALVTAGIPPALVLGPLIEVWAERPGDALAAFERYGDARDHWVTSNGIDRKKSYELLPSRRAWSAQESWAAAKLAAAGMTEADIPRLRAEADKLFRLAAPGVTRNE